MMNVPVQPITPDPPVTDPPDITPRNPPGARPLSAMTTHAIRVPVVLSYFFLAPGRHTFERFLDALLGGGKG
ncbi:MAG TPA: hypothetical protein VEB64_14105 [Azospirillaceae bacterium]|nr:hypothetical protein [Azospirillaceae bacterium]